MSTTAIQSSSAPFYLSPNGSTYYMIVCKTGIRFNAKSDITVEKTDCGGITGISDPEWSFTVDGIVNLTPDIGTAFSYEQLLAWKMGNTLLYVRFNYPDTAGTDFKHMGQAYIADLTGELRQGNAMNFTITVQGTGTLTIS